MLIDVHTHVQFAVFEGDWKEVIDRALKNDVWMINVGTQRDTSKRAVEIANLYKKGVYATVGLHPIHTAKSFHDEQELGLPQIIADKTPINADQQAFINAEQNAERRYNLRPSASHLRQSASSGFVSRAEEFDYRHYRELASDSKVVAIGECGLDYYRLTRTHADLTQTNVDNLKNKQKETFLAQVELAQKLNKALMIHCRPSKGTDDAYEDLLRIILNGKWEMKKIVHFYVGSPSITIKLIEAGYYFTFGGVITFSHDYDEVIKYIPLDRILIETDAPYVAPEPYRGKRNEPAYVVEVAKKIAEVKGINSEAVNAITSGTAKILFGV